MIRKLVILLTVLLLIAVNFSIWSYVNNPLQLQPWTKTTMGVTYDPMRKEDTQTSNTFPSAEDIERDFELLNDKVFAVRTYNVAKEKGLDKIPELAAKHNLNSTTGAWIGVDLEENRRQIDTLIEIGKQYNPKLIRLMVGNEVLLRGDVTEEELIAYIREVKKNVSKPVSTSETWDVWIKHPKFVDEVDFIAIHILPYWEGIAAEDAVDYVFDRYNDVKKAYPNKPVIITEVGWPSDGQPVKHATASIANQAKFLRDFLNRADKAKITYYVVEAFDQPWKKSIEGSAGAYWGIFNADRLAKYPMDGDVMPMPDWGNWAAGASVFSLILMGLIVVTRSSLRLSGIFFFGLMANLAASVIFWTVSSGAHQYQTTLTLVLWGLMVLMQVLATAILLIESLEIAEVVWHRNTIRTFQPLRLRPNLNIPKFPFICQFTTSHL
jgi:exo-beta-1,3-glucanase (GH17 family)